MTNIISHGFSELSLWDYYQVSPVFHNGVTLRVQYDVALLINEK
jgi:hypothetical protein